MPRPGLALSLSLLVATTLAAAPAAAAEAAAPSPAAISAFDSALWAVTRAGGQAIDYQAYLDRFPEGRFATQAQAQLAALRPAYGETAGAPTEAARTTPQQAARLEEAARRDEAAIALDRSARRDIQERLAVLGHGAGGTDGVFGPATRGQIETWQRASGLAVTGYLDLVQITRLIAQTDGRIAAWREDRRAQDRRTQDRRAQESAQQRARTAAASRAKPASAAEPAARPEAETGPVAEARLETEAETETETGPSALIAFSLGLAPQKVETVPARSTVSRPAAQRSYFHDEVGCQE